MNLLRVALAACVLGSAARAQTTLFSDDFEHGTDRWTMDGLWNAEADTDTCGVPRAPFPSGSHCVWYGSDATCTYDRPPGAATFGYLTTIDAIHVPALPRGARAFLRYRNAIDTELCCDCLGYDGTNYDVSRVEVSSTLHPDWQTLATDCNGQQPEPLAWHKGRMDLTPFAGQNVRLRFVLWTWDDNCNSGFGWWIDDVEVVLEAGESFCDAAHDACPCSNGNRLTGNCPNAFDAGVGGCWSSIGKQAELRAIGDARVTADTARLLVDDVPPSTTVLFVQGGASGAGVVFGDGRRCLAGTLVRLSMRSAIDRRVEFPAASDSTLSVRGLVPASGGVRTYQAFYRDTANFCTAATFNVTNGVRVTWLP